VLYTPPLAPRRLDPAVARGFWLFVVVVGGLALAMPPLSVALIGEHQRNAARDHAWREGDVVPAQVVAKRVVEPWGRREIEVGWSGGVERRVILDRALFAAMGQGDAIEVRVAAEAPDVIGLAIDASWWNASVLPTAGLLLVLLGLFVGAARATRWSWRVHRALEEGEPVPFLVDGGRRFANLVRVRYELHGRERSALVEVSPAVALVEVALLVDPRAPDTPAAATVSSFAGVDREALAGVFRAWLDVATGVPLVEAREQLEDVERRVGATRHIAALVESDAFVAASFVKWASRARLPASERRAILSLAPWRAVAARRWWRMSLAMAGACAVVAFTVTSLAVGEPATALLPATVAVTTLAVTRVMRQL
jgi:hypothetical protein